MEAGGQVWVQAGDETPDTPVHSLECHLWGLLWAKQHLHEAQPAAGCAPPRIPVGLRVAAATAPAATATDKGAREK